LKGGLRRDLWTAMSPNIRELQPVIDEADKAFATVGDRLTPEESGALLGRTLRLLIERYEREPPAATFRLISSPMVTWIWLGALIVIGGALIAMWPAPDAARRRATARLAARVAEDLGRTETRTA
jgi:cytochrome c-type biogenesis protein CcmF